VSIIAAAIGADAADHWLTSNTNSNVNTNNNTNNNTNGNGAAGRPGVPGEPWRPGGPRAPGGPEAPGGPGMTRGPGAPGAGGASVDTGRTAPEPPTDDAGGEPAEALSPRVDPPAPQQATGGVPCSGAPSLSLDHTQGGAQFTIYVSPGCPPSDGYQEWIVLERDDEGAPRYFLKYQVLFGGNYSLLSTIQPGTRSGTVRVLYVIEVSDGGYARLATDARAKHANGGVYDLRGATQVSNRVSYRLVS
jgi:hypothetical protein